MKIHLKMPIQRSRPPLKYVLFFLFLSLITLPPLTYMQTHPTPLLAATSDPQLWAVMVGVTEYRCEGCILDEEWNKYPVGIKYPDDDARDLAAQLSPIAGEDHIKLVLNDQATNTGIYYGIKWLAEKSGPGDTAVFYFSGHSAPHYFGSYDYLVSDQQMAEWLDTINSQQVVVILDTCFAGSFTSELGRNGRVLLLSCQPFESALEDREFKNGVFTNYILQALSNFGSSDADGDYELSAEEIFDYASPRTTDEIVAPFANLPAFSSGNVQHPQLHLPPDKFNEFNLFMKATINSDAARDSKITVLSIDGKAYLSSELPISFIWLSGTSHSLDAAGQVNISDGTRLTFADWSDGDESPSKIISRGGDYTAGYDTQYELSIESDYGNPQGSGWYDAGSNAAVSIEPVCEGIIRHTFTGWGGEANSQEAVTTLIMDKSKTITANWHNDYLRLYLLIGAAVVVSVGIIAGIKIRRRNTL